MSKKKKKESLTVDEKLVDRRNYDAECPLEREPIELERSQDFEQHQVEKSSL